LQGLDFKSDPFLASLELLITTFHRPRLKLQKKAYFSYKKH